MSSDIAQPLAYDSGSHFIAGKNMEPNSFQHVSPEARAAQANVAAPVKNALPDHVPRRLKKILNLDDFETAARRKLPRCIYAYISGGSEGRLSVEDNRNVFSEIRYVPRVLKNTSARSISTELFGHSYAAPFGIAPMGMSALSAYRGDLAQARAAATANVPMIMSASSLIPLEQVQRVNENAWFQAYLPAEVEKIFALLERVEHAGFRTLVLTVDTPVSGFHEVAIRNGFSTPLKPNPELLLDGVTHPRWLIGTALRTLLNYGLPYFENSQAVRGAPIISSTVARDFGARDAMDWKNLQLIRRHWKGRFVLKGILDKRDAQIAANEGADGIIISNHGGRQLDGAVTPLQVLPQIVTALGDSYPVMIDSGIRRGNDILKAIALGAKFVFIGRPFNYAGVVAGEQGIRHAIDLLSQDLRRNMALLGINSPQDLTVEQLFWPQGMHAG